MVKYTVYDSSEQLKNEVLMRRFCYVVLVQKTAYHQIIPLA